MLTALPEPSLVVLVITADMREAECLQRVLQAERLDVRVAPDALTGMRAVTSMRPAAVLIGAVGPARGSAELCTRLRAAHESQPVLALAGGDAVEARITLLEAGADDCLSRPFSARELATRLRSIARRAPDAHLSERDVRLYADLRLDHRASRAWRGTRPLMLTRLEFLLLDVLLESPERVLSRSEIFLRVWGYDFGHDSNTLGVYIGYLRRKLEAEGETRLIHTVRSVGYVLRDEPRAAEARRSRGSGRAAVGATAA
jgi:two-component system response regulator MprA